MLALNHAGSATLERARRGPHRMLIDGRWVEAQSGKAFDVYDPTVGQVITSVPEGDAADVDRAVAAANLAFEKRTWRGMAPAERA